MLFEVSHIAHWQDQTVSFNLAFCFGERPWHKVKLFVPAYRLPHLGNWKRAIEEYMHHVGTVDLLLRCEGGSIEAKELPALVDMLVRKPESACYDAENFDKLLKYLYNDHLVKFFTRLGEDPIMLREESFGALSRLIDRGSFEWKTTEYDDEICHYFVAQSYKCPINSRFKFATAKEII